MFSHILVPIALDHADAGDRAIDAAQRLLAEDGQITLLHVLESIPAYVEVQISPDIREGNIRDARAALKKIAAHAKARTDCEVIVGHAARSILDFAGQSEADCVVISSHDPGLQDYFLGSTAGRVVRHAHCAVVVLR